MNEPKEVMSINYVTLPRKLMVKIRREIGNSLYGV